MSLEHRRPRVLCQAITTQASSSKRLESLRRQLSRLQAAWPKCSPLEVRIHKFEPCDAAAQPECYRENLYHNHIACLRGFLDETGRFDTTLILEDDVLFRDEKLTEGLTEVLHWISATPGVHWDFLFAGCLPFFYFSDRHSTPGIRRVVANHTHCYFASARGAAKLAATRYEDILRISRLIGADAAGHFDVYLSIQERLLRIRAYFTLEPLAFQLDRIQEEASYYQRSHRLRKVMNRLGMGLIALLSALIAWQLLRVFP